VVSLPPGFGDSGSGSSNPILDTYTDERGIRVAVIQGSDGTLQRIDLDKVGESLQDQQNRESINQSQGWAQIGISAQNAAISAGGLQARLQEIMLQDQQFYTNLEFLRDKLRIDEQAGRNADRIATQTLVMREQERLDANFRHSQELAQQADQLRQTIAQDVWKTNAQIEASYNTTEYNAGMNAREGALSRNATATLAASQRLFSAVQQHLDRTITVAQANAKIRTENNTLRLQANQQLTEMIRNPQDIAAVAAYVFSPEGMAETAVSQAVQGDRSFITDKSLNPIAKNLKLQDELEHPVFIKEPELDLRGTQASLESVPNAPMLNRALANPRGSTMGGLNFAGSGPITGPGAALFNSFNGGGGAAPTAASSGGWGEIYGIPTNNPSGTQLSSSGFTPGVDAAGNLTAVAAADGLEGVVTEPTLILAGEAGPESVNIKPQNTFANGQPDYLSRARDLLANTAKSALQNLGLQRPFSPAQVSAPGTSPYMQQLAAYLAQSVGGTPSELFLEEANRLRPAGVTIGAVGRSH